MNWEDGAKRERGRHWVEGGGRLRSSSTNSLLNHLTSKEIKTLYSDLPGLQDIFSILGHLEAIGSQGTLLGNIPELRFAPDGRYFYKNFIRGRQPVVIRNAASHWLAVKNWPNETYLNLTYGELPFTVHMYKVYTSSLSVRKDMNLSDFLEVYKEQSIYLDSQFPPSNLINEISLPSILQCNEISSTISDINLLMNGGNASSPLHHDGYENILAIISGTKKVIVFNSSYSQNVYADDFNVLPGLSPINPQQVDLEKFPNFVDVMFYESVLNPGMYNSRLFLVFVEVVVQ